MVKQKVSHTTAELIGRFQDVRSQKWSIRKRFEYCISLTEVQFSTMKKSNTFSNDVLDALIEILPGFTY